VAFIGSFINFIGSWIRYIGAATSYFPLLFIGQIITAIAQVFLLSLPISISRACFPKKKRVLTTGIMTFFNSLGISYSVIILPIIRIKFPIIKDTLPSELLGQALISTTAFVSLFIFFRNRPKIKYEDNEDVIVYSQAKFFWTLFSDIRYWHIFVSFSINIGLYWGMCNMMDKIVRFENNTTTFGTFPILGSLLLFTGIVGVILAHFLQKKYRPTRLIFIFYVTIFVMYSTVLLSALASDYLDHHGNVFIIILAIVSVSILGISFAAIIPLSLETAIEISYPVPGEIISFHLFYGANLFAIVYYFINFGIATKGSRVPSFVVLAASSLLTVPLAFLLDSLTPNIPVDNTPEMKVKVSNQESLRLLQDK